MITIRAWYKMILRVPDQRIKRLVDLYNQNFLPKNLRLALEMIDGLPMDD